jgi:hypothetical protein
MNMRNVRPFLSALAVVLLAGSVARAQSLGELAAKEKERREQERQKNGGATKVITEDDLRGGGKGTFSNAAGTTGAAGEAAKDAPADGSKPAAKEKTDDEIKAEQQAAWRKRLDDANAQVVTLTTRVNELQTALNDMTGNLYSTGRTNALSDLEKAKAELAAAQQSITDLEEEGRRNRFR